MTQDLPVADALARILKPLTPVGREVVPLILAAGRILAETVTSQVDVPVGDNAAMDGFGLCHAEVTENRPIPLAGEIHAAPGTPPPLPSGHAVRIFTGSPIPKGVDTVVMQEDCSWDGQAVTIHRLPEAGANIRMKGEDIAVGDAVLYPGQCLTPAALGVAASCGRGAVRVFRRPKVAILASGDELVPAGAIPGPGQVVSSNSIALATLIQQFGGEVIDLGIARDDKEDLRSRIHDALRHADLLVTSGGVSVGDYDLVKEVLGEVGFEMNFWKIKMKPGKPLAYGRVGPLPVLGLPGNPVSTLVGGYLFLVPALRKLAGAPENALALPRIRVRLTAPMRKKDNRAHFNRVRLERRGGEWWATSAGSQGSGVLSAMAVAEALAILPEESREVAAGDVLDAVVLDPTVLGRNP